MSPPPAGAFGLLRGAAWLTMRVARALPRPRDARLRLALANIWRPKSLTPALIVSIGLTQTLLIALALVEGAIHKELARADAGEIPNFFFIDIPKTQAADPSPISFPQQAPSAQHRACADDARTHRRGEGNAGRENCGRRRRQMGAGRRPRRHLLRQCSRRTRSLSEGEWWPADYNGPPLVSLEQKIAEGLDLAIGDEIKVNVLGRDVVAKVANLRKVDWRSYAINFVMVFSPNDIRERALHGALHRRLWRAFRRRARRDGREARARERRNAFRRSSPCA